MSFLKKWVGEADLPKDLNLLLIIGGLYALSGALSNTFVNVYLWKQSGRFIDLGIYNLSVVFLQVFTFILAGRWAKKMDRTIVLRIGVIFLALFYLAVLIVGENATSFLFLLGGILGIGYGFYWLAFNVLTFEITEPHTRDFFNGFMGILGSAGGMIGPIMAGLIISRFDKFFGYSIVFGLSLTLFSIAVILSFYLKRRPAQGNYLFLRILKERQHNFNWKLVTSAHFFQGLREGTFAFVISIFVFITTGSELAIGTYGLVNSGISFLSYYLVSRYIKKNKRKKAILAGGIGLYLSILLIVFDLSYMKLLIYASVIAICYPLLLVPFISTSYDVIGSGWKAAEMRIEYVVVKELFLNSGRMVSLLTFIGSVYIFGVEQSLPYLLLILGAGHTCIYFFIRKVNIKAG
ncbi:YQGE family putative transporter [Peribacillus deserti]|uniref:YQGE family putative transporter n=1 Tax=Peribacillus deserti TaxID=673318 RepID=A0ABS2QM44_9BACI|nr:MFS transporter [Peribacillus deserti]MBM7693311.1 YQGE family putative transporter [Peribacillus deserti]